MEILLKSNIHITFENCILNAQMFVENLSTAEEIANYSDKHCEIHEQNGTNSFEYSIIWKGSEAIDLLSKLNNYNYYLQPLQPIDLSYKWWKNSDMAIEPSKSSISDSGIDLSIVKKVKQVNNVVFYSTELCVEPPHGYYFDLVPRSSMSKMGYIIANSVGVIDMSYRGPIIVALIKVDESVEDIKLPNKCVQLILRPWYNLGAIEMSNGSETKRGNGGFGSTNQ